MKFHNPTELYSLWIINIIDIIIKLLYTEFDEL